MLKHKFSLLKITILMIAIFVISFIYLQNQIPKIYLKDNVFNEFIDKNISNNQFKDVKLKDITDDLLFIKYDNYKQYLLYVQKMKEISKDKNKTEILELQQKIDLLSEYKNGLDDILIQNKDDIEKLSFPLIQNLYFLQKINDVNNKNNETLQNFYNLILKIKILNNTSNLNINLEQIEMEYEKLTVINKIIMSKNKEKIKKSLSIWFDEVKKTFFFIFTLIVIFYILNYIKQKVFHFNKPVDEQKNNSELYFRYNKIFWFIYTLLVFISLIIFYFDNFIVLLTTIGLAGAGLFLVFKEYILNLIGGFTIFSTKNIMIGNTITIRRDSEDITGKIIDVNLQQIILYETISQFNKTKQQAGRLIYIPNSFIFTNNWYKHNSKDLNILWNKIEIVEKEKKDIDFIIENLHSIIDKHTLIYQKTREKQLEKLNNKYSIITKNETNTYNIDISDTGIVIAYWYLVAASKYFIIRSKIFKDIIDFVKTNKIELSYKKDSEIIEN